MKTEKNIFWAFLLNLLFSVFELVGGIVTGSAAILSDSVHDLADALSIGISWLMERKSHRQPDSVYTYGYRRYSVLGGLITTVILMIGSAAVLIHGTHRLLHPAPVDYKGMVLFACVGLAVNLAAAFLTRDGHSINQKAVNLHMLEDVLGWAVVLAGALVMGFTKLMFLDGLMSVAIALFILYHALKNLWQIGNMFLLKAPEGVTATQLQERLQELDGVLEIHHIHLWSLDGHAGCASMHIVTDGSVPEVKQRVRAVLEEMDIFCAALETESPADRCPCHHCHIPSSEHSHHHHHH